MLFPDDISNSYSFFFNCAVMNLSGVFVFLHCITWSWGDFAGLFTPGKICEYSFNYRLMDLLCVNGLITHHRFTDWPTVDSLRSLLMSFLLGRTQRSYGSSRRVLIFHVQVRHFGVVFVKWWHGVRIKKSLHYLLILPVEVVVVVVVVPRCEDIFVLKL